MKIAYDPEKFGELKPGDDVQVMGVGIVSDDGKSIEIVSIEDQELDEEGDDKDDDKDDEESPKDETQEETDEEMADARLISPYPQEH